MPHSVGLNDGIDGLDEDLLAALDDVLSFSEHNSVADAFAPTPNVPLEDDLDAVLSIESPPLFGSTAPLETCKPPESITQPPNRLPCSPNWQPHTPSSKGKDVRTTPYTTNANKARRRKRPKDELDYLRAKVTDMENKLAVLKQTDQASCTTSSVDMLCIPPGSSQDMLLRWKHIAERQKQEVNRSVVENIRLRSLLEGQLSIAKSLEAAIDQHQQATAKSLSSSDEFNQNDPVKTSDELLFAYLNSTLQAQYAELDTVFERSGIAQMNHDMDNGTKAHQDANGIYVRHEVVRVLPFSMDAVQRTIWGIFRHSAAKEMMFGPFQAEVIDENRMNITMMEKVTLNKRETTILRRISVMRVFEKHRTVLVWSSFGEITGSMFVRLHEKGYWTSSPFHFGTNELSGGVQGSVTRIVLLVSPEITAVPSLVQSNAHVGEMTELVVGTSRMTMNLIYQITDTLLLLEAMGGQITGEEDASQLVTTTST
ncbi:hypothetical protein CCR75_000574 [Bremia lactucae]|uniref:Uncharacterized protein n=1 Tax=Bremia lactucae TaxID=4779 RepID=A0A976NYP0_BRELC|nr:hypothetical protein CCR75_000574 [Bremia lactucae]